MIRTDSIKFKVTVLYTLILGGILLLYSLLLYTTLRHTLYKDIQKELLLKAGKISAIVKTARTFSGGDEDVFFTTVHKVLNPELIGTDTLEPVEERMKRIADRYDLVEDFIRIGTPEGETVGMSEPLPPRLQRAFAEYAAELARRKETKRFDVFRQGSVTMMVITQRYMADGEEYLLQIGTRMMHITRLLNRRLVFAAVTIPVVLLLTSCFGWMLAARILKPVQIVAETAKRITHEDLSSRVQVQGIDREMLYLVDAFNDMIARLEKAFRYISQFSSHVAHELKTPLAVIRGEAEVALRKDRPPEEYRKTIENSVGEIRGMIRLIEDMLLLATLEYDASSLRLRPVHLTALLRDICEQAAILAGRKGIRVLEAP